MDLKQYRQAALAYWASRSERERRMLMLWAIGVAVFGLYFGVITPVQQKTASLQKRIPVLEKQLLLMRAQTPVIQQRPGSNAADLRSRLFEILAAKQISADIRTLSNGRTEIRLPALSTREALALAESLREETHAMIAALQINTNSGQTVQLVLEMGQQ